MSKNLAPWLVAASLILGGGSTAWNWSDVNADAVKLEAANIALKVVQAKLDEKKAEANIARAEADAKESASEKILIELSRQKELAKKYETLSAQRGVELNKALKRISDVPSTDDGQLAPVLKRVLESHRVRRDVVSGERAADGDHAGAGGSAAATDPGPGTVLPETGPTGP